MTVLATSTLLSATLALVLLSFIATLFVILRTLLPLIPPHILSRHSRPGTPLPVFGYATQQGQKKKLRSAQRFHCWLAFVDLAACAVWLWEVVALASGSPNSPARIAFAICARPTILLVVGVLSYFNVIRGKVVDLGRFDTIVWIPSAILLAVMVSLAYVAPSTSKTVWEVMLGVQVFLLVVCSICFGRLLLAVFRVRRDTVKAQMQRQRVIKEEKQAYAEHMLDRQREQDEQRQQQDNNDQPPLLPPLKTNRWLISKTFLLAKASSAANTVSASIHRRSASTTRFPAAPRPSTTSERHARPSHSSERHRQSNETNAPYGFLAHDPTTTTRYGHFRASSNSQAELQPVALTPRSITFTQEAQARAVSPAPSLIQRFGAFSRMTNISNLRVSTDEPRPSMSSYMSTDSSSTDQHQGSRSGVLSFLSAQRLYNGRNAGLSRKEAKKASARMGGHLVSCITNWICVIPFLVYKIHNPASAAPFYAALMVAIGITIPGPLLALQTIVADGLWFKPDLVPLMSSSSAVAFEHLDSRPNTPFPLSANTAGSRSQSPTQPTSATSGQSASATGQATKSNTTQHRTSSSNDSTSSSSLASIAAFSNPPPGLVRHSFDTTDAPSSQLARLFSMAAPHPKLQVIGRGSPSPQHNHGLEGSEMEVAAGNDEDWQKKEARKLKSFSLNRESLNRKRSSTLTALSAGRKTDDGNDVSSPRSRRSILGIKDANAITLHMLQEADRKTPSPAPSMHSRRSVISTASSSKQDRRRSAPVTPSSQKSSKSDGVSEDGVLVKRQTLHNPMDGLTASLLTNLVPGIKIGESSGLMRTPSSRKKQPATPESSTSSVKKRKPDLKIPISHQQSHFTKCDKAVDEAPMAASSGLEIGKEGSEGSKRHLRRRSRTAVPTASSVDTDISDAILQTPVINDAFVTRRAPRRQLSPAVEAEEEEEEEPMRETAKVASPIAPRSSLDIAEDAEDDTPLEDSRLEVLSDSHSPLMLSPSTPAAIPESPYPYANTTASEQSRPSIILRSKPAEEAQENDEVGTVSMAYRVPRVVSRRSSFSSDLMLRPSSRASATSSGDITSNLSRSDTIGSITSLGFRNMIQSNRNSWTGSVNALDEFMETQRTSERPEPASVLGVRDVNKLSDNVIQERKSIDKLRQPEPAPPATPVSAVAPTHSTPTRVALADIRTAMRQAPVDENRTLSPTPRQGNLPAHTGSATPRRPAAGRAVNILSMR